MKFSSQKGFTLLEVSIATAIAALGIMATLQMRAAQTQIDAARSVAQVYERLNSAIGNYMTIYYKDIINKARVSPDCGKSAYQIPTDGILDNVNHGSNCKIEFTVNGETHSIDNFLQPKPKDLAKLGLLTASDAEYETKLPLPSFALAGGTAPTRMVAHNISLDASFGPPEKPARNGMAFLISLQCIENGVNNVCSIFEMRSLVYNIQPYSNIDDNATLLYRVVGAAGGGRTYLSDTRFNGKLRADGGVSELPNPIKMRNTTDGPPYILAMRNGYSVDDKNQFLRKDGSTPLTADWNVGGQSITGINNLAAGSATVAGELRAGKGVFGDFMGTLRAALNATTAYFSGNVTTDGALTVAGATNLNNNLSVAGATNLNNNLSVAGATNLNNNLSVDGATNLNGNLSVTGGTKVADFKLKNEAKLGDACNPQDQTLVRASESSAGFNDTALRMLVCDPVTSRWTRAQADYAPQIAEINSAILSLGGQISGINTSINGINTGINSINSGISGINDAVSDFKKRLVKVEDEYMTWDIINVNWDAAKAVTTQTGTVIQRVLEPSPTNANVPRYVSKEVPVYETKLTAKSYVWKRTPFACKPFNVDANGNNTGLPQWDTQNDVRWKKWASEVQKSSPGSSYTPPVFIGFDNTPDEEVVYDVNCENGYWYVGISTKATNKANGNICRDGLVSPNSFPPMGTYTPATTNCTGKNFNASTPSFNLQTMSARFIAFTKK